MRKELLKGLTAEQIEKASRCHSEAELIALAKEEGVELTKEQLAAVNGGACKPHEDFLTRACPRCGEQMQGEFVETTPGDGKYHFICKHCGFEWFEK